MTSEINNYISKRYERWLDYSEYHCTHAGIADEALDVLNEVLCSLLQKNEKFLLSLLHKKSGQYTELDYYVLRMIKLNATSLTSPYRQKYSAIPRDENGYCFENIPDVDYEEVDTPAEIMRMTNKVREAVEALNLSEKHRKIFDFKFFQAESFRDWKGTESISELYKEYNRILELVKSSVHGEMLL
ncbi:MAG: hypothetical protein GX102_13765 [Porphyromonadaceae bacterium]|jgi:hypothetical protein|nr:hypothetical protein [Porphyromonadaceae bacterium]